MSKKIKKYCITTHYLVGQLHTEYFSTFDQHLMSIYLSPQKVLEIANLTNC